jgi:hypothetical protein
LYYFTAEFIGRCVTSSPVLEQDEHHS